MTSKIKFVTLLLVSILIVIGTIIFSMNLWLLGKSTEATILILVMIFLVGTLSVLLRKSYNDLKAGLPSGDERTYKIRMFSAGYAYFISLYIWIVLLAFHKYLDSDDLLMFGLLGMAISFGVSWLFMNNKKDLE
ncbi:hypothetical protein [Desulfosporosinus sp. OT]|uniref:hypothetical protein n=1 Tax=Desulfosporosinus sp. OT TaxID=913865 RepID=UPI000223A7AA|nr:hypothetical protein [Desulfosporosinus sp. OT]EGW37772.1 putative membrane protein [Desulfosporosinus sp. OT]